MDQELLDIIHLHHKDGVSKDVCTSCSAGCCSQGGFAILENVLEIYKIYSNGKLKRKGMKFIKGLSLKEFIYEYFDIWERPIGENEEPLMFFHMRSIDEKGRAISIPGDSYWKSRSELFNRNPWLNRGCIFLSDQVPNWPEDDGKKRNCILHGLSSGNEIGPKPIDCLFYTCTERYKAKTPKEEETDKWFIALSRAFPNSLQRFKEIVEEDD